jgi:cell division protein FtsB
MTLQEFTLATQVATLVLIGLSSWNVSRTVKLSRQVTKAIEGYRSELGWLTARLELLEAERQTRMAK